jgi:hypothetical protein
MLLLSETVVSTIFELLGVTVDSDFFESSPILVELCKQRLLKVGKTFQSKFNGLNNLKRFTSTSVIALFEQLF